MSEPTDTEKNVIDFTQCSLKLDTSGLNCPKPLMLARTILSKMEPDETLYIISTDPACIRDFKAFCKHTNHSLVQYKDEEDKFHVLIKLD